MVSGVRSSRYCTLDGQLQSIPIFLLPTDPLTASFARKRHLAGPQVPHSVSIVVLRIIVEILLFRSYYSVASVQTVRKTSFSPLVLPTPIMADLKKTDAGFIWLTMDIDKLLRVGQAFLARSIFLKEIRLLSLRCSCRVVHPRV